MPSGKPALVQSVDGTIFAANRQFDASFGGEFLRIDLQFFGDHFDKHQTYDISIENQRHF